MYYPINPFGRQAYGWSPRVHQNQNQYRGQQASTITVEGEGRVTASPDQAKMTVGVVTENEQIIPAQQENTLKSNQVIAALKGLGVDGSSITTVVYSIQPQYDFIDGKQVFQNFRVVHQLEVTVKDITKVGMILAAVFNNGANRVENISFLVSSPDVFEQDALKKAISHARGKAEALAQAIGTQLNKFPLKVREQISQTPVPYPVLSFKTAEAVQQTPPIQAGEFTIVAKVTVVFEFRPLSSPGN